MCHSIHIKNSRVSIAPPQTKLKAHQNLIQIDLKSGSDKRLGKVVSDISNMFRETNDLMIKRIEKDYTPSKADILGTEAIDNFYWIYRRFKGTGNERWHSPLAKDLNWSIENYRYRHAKLKRYTDDMINKVVKPAEELGYNSIDLGTMLFLRNIAESSQRNKLVNSLGIMKVNPELAKKLGDRTAKEIYDYYAKMHPDLLNLTNKFYKVRQEMVIPELKESGMYDQIIEQFQQLSSNFIPFSKNSFHLKQ